MTTDEVRAIRQATGLGVGEFAALVGCAPNQVWRWEHGVTAPSPAYRRELARIAARYDGGGDR